MNKKICTSGLMLPFTMFLCLSLCSLSTNAEDIESMENKSLSMESELTGINSELLEMGTQIADTEEKINRSGIEMQRLQDSLAISRNNEEQQRQDMASRIRYMYENDSVELINIICSADSMADFLNKVDFIQNISDYDRTQMNHLSAIREGIELQETALSDEQNKLGTLKSDLEKQKQALDKRATELSADLITLKAEINRQKAIEAERAAQAERAARAARESQAAREAQAQSGQEPRIEYPVSDDGSGVSYSYPYASGGALTPWKGVVYFNGHRETYYSQRVLPGNGLRIPGRHVAPDGTIRDIDDYICVASSDLPKGTIVETSLGMGKVYDCGCASGTIDIYTDW